MKKVLLITLVLLSLVMVSCVNNNKVPVVEQPQVDELALSQIVGLYEIEDMTDLGVWVLSLNEDVLSGKLPIRDLYVLKIDEKEFELKRNPLMHQQYLILLPETLTKEQISSGTLEVMNAQRGITKRLNGDISIESVYIQRSVAENGTNLFAMTLTDYVILKKAKKAPVYENGKLLRPVYVKSSDGYVYAMRTYYNARQAASSHTVDGAFEFLKTRDDHADYLFEGEPNRVSINQSDEVVTLAPDTRDRVRDLGTMGDVETTNAYNILSEGSNMAVYVARANIPSKYQSSNYFDIEVKGTLYKLIETAKPGIFMVAVPQSVTTNVDLLKNARFQKSSPFSGGEGTAENPFEISNADELNAIRGDYLGTPGNGYHFKQVADINLSSSDYAANWTPIGTDTTPFCGSYDGQSFKISNLLIDASDQDYNGLFGTTESATLLNLTLEDAFIVGHETSGFISGMLKFSFVKDCDVYGKFKTHQRAGGIAGRACTSTIDHCSASVTFVESERALKGGIVGIAMPATITNCHGKILVDTELGTGKYSIGGITGASLTGSMLSNCSAEGKVIGYFNNVGGLSGTNSGVIESSHADVYINIEGGATGGFVGNNSGIIRDSFSKGDVRGGTQVGGFVGMSSKSLETDSCIIERCFSEGDVTGFVINPQDDCKVGGFAGSTTNMGFFAGIVRDSYSLGTVTGPDVTGGFTGQLKGDSISIENCYAAGNVISDSEWSGGFYGEALTFPNVSHKEATVVNCYWDITTTGQASSLNIIGGEGKLTPEMKQKGTFSGWDFESAEPVWTIVEGNGEYSYPYLVNNEPTTAPGRTMVSNVFNGGNGTPEYPYEIATWEQFSKLNEAEYRDKHFKLVTHLTSHTGDYEDYASANANSNWGWTPLGTQVNPFTGSLDGNGYRIKDVYAMDNNNNICGLFGYIENATLTNCIVENATVKGPVHVGILAGYSINSQIINSSVSGYVDPLGGYCVDNDAGGLVGTNEGSITNCVSLANLGNGYEGDNVVGGLVGRNSGWIVSSSSSSTIAGGQNIGGLVGINTGTVKFSHSTAKVSGEQYTGGFAGYNDSNNGGLDQCFSSGTVTALDDSLSNAGGFVGQLENGTIQNCYSTSVLKIGAGVATNSLGGFIGFQNHGGINNCYSTGYEEAFCGSGWSNFNEQNYWWSYENRKANFEIKNAVDTYETSLKALYQYEMRGYISDSGWDYTDIWETTSEAGKWISPSLRNITAEQKPGYVDEVTFGDETADGTAEKPFLIWSKGALEAIRGVDYIDKGYYYILPYYLSLNNTAKGHWEWETDWDNWTPIGDETTPFKGVVDGLGHSISGMKCETDGIYNGVFGVIEDATLTNIQVAFPMLTGNGTSGSLVGLVKPTAVVENCHLYSNISTWMIVKNGTAGGLIGKNQGTVNRSSAYCFVNQSSTEKEVVLETDSFGGLIAINEGTVEQCYSHAYLRNNNTSMVLGGLVAKQNSGTIRNSYFFGNLRGYDTIGGLVAQQTGGTIDKCYASAKIVENGANTKMGAMIGEKTGGTANGYWESDVYTKSAAGSSLTRTQMKAYTSFVGWDFSDVWRTNGTYPWLLDNEQDPHPVRE